MNSERILVVGAGGRLGAAIARGFGREFSVTGLARNQLDLTKLEQVSEALSQHDFDLLINCAALTNVDYCESHHEQAFLLNSKAPGLLANLCKEKGAKFVHFSTDYVFDGAKKDAYLEEDEATPLSVYGESKLHGERAVLGVSSEFMVARVSWVFGPDRPSFVDGVIARARESSEVPAVADKFSTPTYTNEVADRLRLAWESGARGVLHLPNGGSCSWQEYAQHALDCCRAKGIPLRTDHVRALRLADMDNFVARRPVNSVLSTRKFTQLTGRQPRHWRDAVRDYIATYVS